MVRVRVRVRARVRPCWRAPVGLLQGSVGAEDRVRAVEGGHVHLAEPLGARDRARDTDTDRARDTDTDTDRDSGGVSVRVRVRVIPLVDEHVVLLYAQLARDVADPHTPLPRVRAPWLGLGLRIRVRVRVRMS